MIGVLLWWGTKKAILPPDDEVQLIREFLGRKAGFFVHVGANDLQLKSQTWQLEQDGWSGVLIEPQPDLAECLQVARRAKVYAVACSSPTNSGKLMSLHLAGPLSSLNPLLTEVTRRSTRTIAVPARTLDDVLIEASGPTPHRLFVH